MQNQVVIIDTTARRTTVKFRPETHLVDIRREACTKLGRQVELFGLKFKGKLLDLSLSARLHGLQSGSKLELVQLSQTPSVISVALQVFEPDGTTFRMTDKLSSDTTLWKAIRMFESSLPRGQVYLTGRAAPILRRPESGSGRLYYERPNLLILGRVYTSLEDLQKTFAQLGFTNGSVLLRLSFERTQQFIEDALAEISNFFASIGKEKELDVEHSTRSKLPSTTSPSSATSLLDLTEKSHDVSLSATQTGGDSYAYTPSDVSAHEPYNAGERNIFRKFDVYAAPSSSTLLATTQPFDASAYEPSLDQAKAHQTRLALAGSNRRLASDEELSNQILERRNRLSTINEVELKLRFPEQVQVVAKFHQADTSEDLYAFVTDLLENGRDSFCLQYKSEKGPRVIAPSKEMRLISGLGITGRTLIEVIWKPDTNAMDNMKPSVKSALKDTAKSITIPDDLPLDDHYVEQEPGVMRKSKHPGLGNKGIPKWLRLPGRA